MNMGEALSREVERVSALRARYEETGRITKDAGPMQPAIVMMNGALEQAHMAAGSANALWVLRAYEDLRGFTE